MILLIIRLVEKYLTEPFCKSFFTTTNTKGELIQVDTKGNISRQRLNLEANHDITTSAKTLVVRNENKLSINMNNVDLEYGKYSSPSLFYLNSCYFANY